MDICQLPDFSFTRWLMSRLNNCWARARVRVDVGRKGKRKTQHYNILEKINPTSSTVLAHALRIRPFPTSLHFSQRVEGKKLSDSHLTRWGVSSSSSSCWYLVDIFSSIIVHDDPHSRLVFLVIFFFLSVTKKGDAWHLCDAKSSSVGERKNKFKFDCVADAFGGHHRNNKCTSLTGPPKAPTEFESGGKRICFSFQVAMGNWAEFFIASFFFRWAHRCRLVGEHTLEHNSFYFYARIFPSCLLLLSKSILLIGFSLDESCVCWGYFCVMSEAICGVEW